MLSFSFDAASAATRARPPPIHAIFFADAATRYL